MSDATGVAEAMLGLPGFRVLAVDETPLEVVIPIETSADRVGCPASGWWRSPMTGCPSSTATSRCSAALRAWSGQSGAGAARSPYARLRTGSEVSTAFSS